jgi:hypothetical protein
VRRLVMVLVVELVVVPVLVLHVSLALSCFPWCNRGQVVEPAVDLPLQHFKTSQVIWRYHQVDGEGQRMGAGCVIVLFVLLLPIISATLVETSGCFRSG